jgi:hypothetical protein
MNDLLPIDSEIGINGPIAQNTPTIKIQPIL